MIMWHKESILVIVIEALRRIDSLSRFDLAFVQCEVAVGIGCGSRIIVMRSGDGGINVSKLHS